MATRLRIDEDTVAACSTDGQWECDDEGILELLRARAEWIETGPGEARRDLVLTNDAKRLMGGVVEDLGAPAPVDGREY